MKRISSIDFTRGLVMIIMAIDHSRDLLHITSLTQNPLDFATTTPGLFMTRWITHLCAPTFVFLSGVSAYIVFKKENNFTESRRFLLTRGLWLVLLEITFISFGFWWDLHFRMIILQVIFAIGSGFVVLSLLLKIPARIIGIIGLAIIFSHNLLQGIGFPDKPALNVVWSLFFSPNLFPFTPHFSLLIMYPLIPWLGILLLGFGCGQLFELSSEKRRTVLWQIGLASLVLFAIIRYTNTYGDPGKWSVQKTPLFTFLSFINVNKYPPSLLYILVTLGVSFLILSLSEGVKNRFTDIISIYGKVPLFYYLIHWHLVHVAMIIMLYVQGFSGKDFNFAPFFGGRPEKGISGVDLPGLYLIWLIIIIVLYPLCKWYNNYKSTHRENKWLRYL